MNEINRKLFSLLWLQICNGIGCGTNLINRRDIGVSSNYDIPVIWIQNYKLGIKIMAYVTVNRGKAEEFVYLYYSGKKDKLGRTIDRKFFGRVRGGKYAAPFIFLAETLLAIDNGDMNLALTYVDQKMAELKKASTFSLIAQCVDSRPCSKNSPSTKARDSTSRSVRTISGGLYGLGKNRKH